MKEIQHFEEVGRVYIPGHVPSFKNSKMRTKTGLMIPSKAYRTYLKDYEIFWKTKATEFKELAKDLDYPYYVAFFFIRKTKHIFDYHNICAGPLDLMSKYGWIPDDDMEHILPVPPQIEGKSHLVDPKNPGCYVCIYKKYVN